VLLFAEYGRLVLFEEEGIERIEPRCPERALLVDPGAGFVEWGRFEGEPVLAPRAATPNQARALQEPNVLRYGVERDLEGRCELRHPSLAPSQPLQDGPSRWIGESQQGVIEPFRQRPSFNL